MNPPLPTMEEGHVSPHIPAGPKKDYSLKDDQTFTISIPGRVSKSGSGSTLLESTGSIGAGSNMSSAMSGHGGSFPLLPPPPPSVLKKP
jgi:adaptin ear-binding coat-associated protein 1/2